MGQISDDSVITIEKRSGRSPDTAGIILLFSGGRDSSCAAVRLTRAGKRPLLLTVIDSPFQDDNRTSARVHELRNALGDGFGWMSTRASSLYRQTLALSLDTAPSCLPCFFVRIAVGIVLARAYKIREIAAGFTKYQSAWVEQSPVAVEESENFLRDYELHLLLPVRDLASKEESCAVLEANLLSIESLEPRCHCADPGTRENAAPGDIRSDIRKLAACCRPFIDRASIVLKSSTEGE